MLSRIQIPPLFDQTQIDLLRDALGDEELSEMHRQLPSAVARLLTQIDEAVKNADMGEIRASAHALKGVASSFAASRLENAARLLELDVQSIDEAVACQEILADIASETELGLLCL